MLSYTLSHVVSQTWTNRKTHTTKVLREDWYKATYRISCGFNVATTKFFTYEKGLSNVDTPLTTNSVSSPMGKGSDSQPVQVNFIRAGHPLYFIEPFLLFYWTVSVPAVTTKYYFINLCLLTAWK